MNIVASSTVKPIYSILVIDVEESKIISFLSALNSKDDEDNDIDEQDEKSDRSKIIFQNTQEWVNKLKRACRNGTRKKMMQPVAGKHLFKSQNKVVISLIVHDK